MFLEGLRLRLEELLLNFVKVVVINAEKAKWIENWLVTDLSWMILLMVAKLQGTRKLSDFKRGHHLDHMLFPQYLYKFPAHT